MHQLAVQVKQHTLGESLFSKRQPEYLPYRQEKAQDLNIEHARVKCALPPHVMPDVTMFVTTYVEAHGIPTGTARSACRVQTTFFPGPAPNAGPSRKLESGGEKFPN